jgi:hypothetical protein
VPFVDYLGSVLLAVGAALAVGTGLALLSYRRTGAFPGQPEDAPTPRAAVGTAVTKLVVGAALSLVGFALLVT